MVCEKEFKKMNIPWNLRSNFSDLLYVVKIQKCDNLKFSKKRFVVGTTIFQKKRFVNLDATVGTLFEKKQGNS